MINGEKEILENAIDYYGENSQVLVAIEEMSELTKELCKWFRDDYNIDHIAEEIADVRIMLNQLVIIFNVKELTHRWRVKKIKRLAKRIRENE